MRDTLAGSGRDESKNDRDPTDVSGPQSKLTDLIVIGVDGGEPALFERWMRSGDMPYLASLEARSLRARTQNPFALEAGAVWPVFHTSLMPGRQPQFDGRRYFDAQDYSYRWFTADKTRPNLWQHLSAHGKHCLVIDAPYVQLDPTLNGAMILDWAAHVAANGQTMTFQTHPAALKDEILDLVGPDPTGGVTCDRRKLESAADYRAFIDDYLSRIDKKAEITCHMLAKGGWDYVESVFTDLHCMGHHLWHVTDPDHPNYSAKLHKALGDPLHEGYKAFDRALGRILDCLSPDTTIVFYTSHGMGPQYTGTGLLDRLLQTIDQGKPATPQRRSLKAQIRTAWHSLPGEWRAALRHLRKPFAGVLDTHGFITRYDNRRFFEVFANNATGGVRLNIKGREAQGCVDPADAASLLEEIAEAILECRNVETGEPFAEDCVITRKQYSGPYTDYLPDLLVRWNRSAPIRAIQSPRIGLLHQDYASFRTGDHTPHGQVMMAGPGIAPHLLNDDLPVADLSLSLLARLDCGSIDSDGTVHDALTNRTGS